MDKYRQDWQKILALLKDKIGEIQFNETFKDCDEVYKFENNYYYIIVPNLLQKFRIEKFQMQNLTELIPYISNEKVGFRFISRSEIPAEEPKNQLVTPDEPRSFGRNLSNLYRFSNFEVGKSNRYAYLTATKVAENGVKICNPLYIFGDVGLGKTHLMTSIGNYILDNDINANVVYTSSQKFAEDYFLATSSKSGNNRIEAFYNKYNSADVLLVDDIQFLEGKTATQEEFFKIFEHLYSNNKQIVITSDRPALNLKNLMDRLRSRFNWGISVDIKHPDKELLINILKNKLRFLITDPKDVEDVVLEKLADSFPDNIRDMEGALRTFVNYCTCMNAQLSLDNLFVSLESILPKSAKKTDAGLELIAQVKKIVCSYFKVSAEDLNATTRKQQVTYARQILMYILRNNFNISLQIIGDNLGSRDHATISHGVDKIASLLKTDESVKNDIDFVVKSIKM